jgi:phytoene synthase
MVLRPQKIILLQHESLPLISQTYEGLTRSYLLADAEELMAKHGKSFYFASLIFSPRDLKKIATLYRLCRYIDDCADELPEAESSLALSSILTDLKNPQNETSFNLLMKEVESWGVKRDHIRELLLGAEFDVRGGEIRDEKDLMLYCYRVAGVVGLMMCPLIGVTSTHAHAHAIDLGIGMQLTNICRDIKEDRERGRCYIPGVNSLCELELKARIEKTLDIADLYYKSAYEGLSYIPFRARVVIFLAGELYRNIGMKIRRNDYDVSGNRIYLNLAEKLIVTVKSFLKLGKSFFWKPKSHQHELHFLIQHSSGGER